MLRTRIGRAMLGSAWFAVCHVLWAGTVEVSPVTTSLSTGHAIQAFTVRNNGQAEATLQVSLMKWDQEHGRDVLVPTDTLLSTPPLFTVAPGQSQIVRVGMRHLVPGDVEAAYRMLLTEVPPPPQPGFRGLSVTLRLSIPIFVAPAKSVPPALTWRIAEGPGGSVTVDAANSGSVHIKVLSLSLWDKETKGHMQQDASQYVLANSQGQWRFASLRIRAGDHVVINAKTSAGDIHAEAVAVTP